MIALDKLIRNPITTIDLKQGLSSFNLYCKLPPVPFVLKRRANRPSIAGHACAAIACVRQPCYLAVAAKIAGARLAD
jgi:hypothetical protein